MNEQPKLGDIFTHHRTGDEWRVISVNISEAEHGKPMPKVIVKLEHWNTNIDHH